MANSGFKIHVSVFVEQKKVVNRPYFTQKLNSATQKCTRDCFYMI